MHCVSENERASSLPINVRNLVFWQEIISILQLPYLRAIASIRPHWNVQLVVDMAECQLRKNMGWAFDSTPVQSNFQIVVAPSSSEKTRLLSLPDALHLLGGIRGSVNSKQVIEAQRDHGYKIGLITEDVDLRGVRAITRKLASFVIERPLRHKFDIVFCIGRSSAKWYQYCGFDKRALVPFAYSVDTHQFAEHAKENVASNILRILFVGELTRRKNVRLLLNSMSHFSNSDFRGASLTIVGVGPEATNLKRQASALGLTGSVEFLGTIQNMLLGHLMSRHDVLVLPSEYDGWGAVVNEALHAGLYSIASNSCGSSIIFERHHEPGCILGAIFKRGDRTDLARIINHCSRAIMSTQARMARSRWAEANISPRVMATLMCDEIDYRINGIPRQSIAPDWTKFSVQ